MDLTGFLEALRRMDGDDLQAIAGAIAEHHRTVADEVEAWETLMSIDDALRVHGQSRRAAQAAHSAIIAVREAAQRSQIALPDATATRVAREAAVVARGLVAGEHVSGLVGRILTLEWGTLEPPGARSGTFAA